MSSILEIKYILDEIRREAMEGKGLLSDDISDFEEVCGRLSALDGRLNRAINSYKLAVFREQH